MILYGNFFRSFSLDFPPLGPLPCMVRFDSCNLVSSTARWSPGLVCAVACYFCSSTLLLLGLHAAFTQLWACLLSQPCICGVKWMKYRDRLRGVTVTTQAAQSRKFLHPGMSLLAKRLFITGAALHVSASLRQFALIITTDYGRAAAYQRRKKVGRESRINILMGVAEEREGRRKG